MGVFREWYGRGTGVAVWVGMLREWYGTGTGMVWERYGNATGVVQERYGNVTALVRRADAADPQNPSLCWGPGPGRKRLKL